MRDKITGVRASWRAIGNIVTSFLVTALDVCQDN